jgi:hypothetical protein
MEAQPMNKTLLLMAVLALALLPVANADFVSQGLVARYSFDDCTAKDVTGGGSDGNIIGAVCVDGGIQGSKAMQFNGENNYIDLRSPTAFPDGSSPRTLCGWGKPNTTYWGWGWIASYGNDGTGKAMFIGMNGDTLYGGGMYDDVTLQNFWDAGTWSFICLTYDGTTAKLYENGKLAGIKDKNWNLEKKEAYIGKQVAHEEYWKGLIDEVTVYNRVLSEAETKQLYDYYAACAEGESKCDGNNTITCVNNQWKSAACRAKQKCSLKDGKAVCESALPKICEAYSKRCLGSELQSCSSDGTEWSKSKTCTAGCEEVYGTAQCKSTTPAKSYTYTSSSGSSSAAGAAGVLGVFGAILGAGLLIIAIAAILGLVSFVLWIWFIIEIIKAKNDSGWKILWGAAITFLGLLGIAVYYFIGRKDRLTEESQASQASETQAARPAQPMAPPSGGYQPQLPERRSPPAPSAPKIPPMLDPATQQLVGYIRASRSQGAGDDAIRQALLGAGWPQEKIDEAFANS